MYIWSAVYRDENAFCGIHCSYILRTDSEASFRVPGTEIKMTRREIRESAFIIIFEKLMRDDPAEELYTLAEEVEGLEINDKVKEIVEGVIEHEEEIDGIISKYSTKRAVSRIPKVILSILRIAVFEALYDDMTPVNAAISEAVKLSEAYSYKEDTSFVNGVLSSFSKNISGDKNVLA